MALDKAKLKPVLRAIHDRLSESEATAIVDVARLAAAIDKRTNVTEMALLVTISEVIFAMTGSRELRVPSGAIDTRRLHDIGEELVRSGPRELAFACAFLVMIHDLELTQEEGQLAGRLAEALLIDPARANQLALQMESVVRAA